MDAFFLCQILKKWDRLIHLQLKRLPIQSKKGQFLSYFLWMTAGKMKAVRERSLKVRYLTFSDI